MKWKRPVAKEHTSYDSTDRRRQNWQIQGQKVNEWLLGVEGLGTGRMGVAANGDKVFFWSDENILNVQKSTVLCSLKGKNVWCYKKECIVQSEKPLLQITIGPYLPKKLYK